MLLWGGTGSALQSGEISEVLNQFCEAPSSLLLVATEAMGINRDHGYSRATDPDTAPCSSSGPDDDLALGGFYCVGLAAAQPSGTKKATGGGPDPGNQCRLW